MKFHVIKNISTGEFLCNSSYFKEATCCQCTDRVVYEEIFRTLDGFDRSDDWGLMIFETKQFAEDYIKWNLCHMKKHVKVVSVEEALEE